MHLAGDLGARQTLTVPTGDRVAATPAVGILDVGRSSRRPPKGSSEHQVQPAGRASIAPISQHPIVGGSPSDRENRPVLASILKASLVSSAISEWVAVRDQQA